MLEFLVSKDEGTTLPLVFLLTPKPGFTIINSRNHYKSTGGQCIFFYITYQKNIEISASSDTRMKEIEWLITEQHKNCKTLSEFCQ